MMKKALIVLMLLTFSKASSLADLKLDTLPCYLNYISPNHYGCSNGMLLDSKFNIKYELKNSIRTIDENEDELVVITIDDDGNKTLVYIKDKVFKNMSISSDINKAYVTNEYILLTSLASELKILDKDFNQIKKEHFSYASINASSINKAKNTLAIVFESGKLLVYDYKNFKYITKEIHKDNIYNVDYKNDLIVTCSTDRRVVVSTDSLEIKNIITTDNLVYNCALDNELNVAYSCDVENNICYKDEKINIGNLYLNGIDFDGNFLRLNAYSNKLYRKVIE